MRIKTPVKIAINACLLYTSGGGVGGKGKGGRGNGRRGDQRDVYKRQSQMFTLGHVYYFKKTAEEDQFEDMVKQVKESLKEQDQILIKGSNSMNLAKLVEELENGK